MKPRLMSLIFLLERWNTPIPSLEPVTRGSVALDRDQCAADGIGDETGVTGCRSRVDVEDHARPTSEGPSLAFAAGTIFALGNDWAKCHDRLTPAVRGAGLLTCSAVAACAKQK
jgi:hypothetical protein